MALELYSYPTSFYAQKIQLALRSKGIEYSLKPVDLLSYENLQPWYLKINPAGQVPTLKHGDKLVPDSSAIITYLDQHFGGPKLQPDATEELGNSARQFYGKIDGIKIPVLTIGSLRDPELAKAIKLDEETKNFFREKLLSNRDKDVLEKLLAENPEFQDLYKGRLERAKEFDEKFSKQNVDKAKEEANAVFKEVEIQLNKMDSENEGRPSWLFGSSITAADVSLAITLFRLSNLGIDKDTWSGRLPKLERYFTFAKENLPGFEAVTANGF